MNEERGLYALDLVEKLAFVRYGGTDAELKAANILLKEIESAGGEGRLMDFTVPAAEVEKCALKAVAPNERDIECSPYWLSGELPEGGAELKFCYASRGTEEDLAGFDSLEGYAVMLDMLTEDAYKLLCARHASAFITFVGKWYDTDATLDLMPNKLRPHLTRHGVIPGFIIKARDATELVRANTSALHAELRQRELENTSRNVIAEIRGTERPEEVIVITAHYDSILAGTGSWDNASGTAAAMALYRRFLKEPPRRTLRFIWCGSEEQGLLGSRAYVEANEELLPQIKFCFNFDMCGTVLGPNEIFVTGGDDLLHYAQQYSRETGWAPRIEVTVHSSDSAPFADRGIPALGISRGTRSASIHTSNDLVYPLCASEFASIEDFAAGLIARTANAVLIPVGTGMPDSMKTSLDKYFHREKDANNK